MSTPLFQDLEQERTYKYLGVSEGVEIQQSQMEEKFWKEYYCRIWLVLKSELNSANKLKAINTLAVPVVTYSTVLTPKTGCYKSWPNLIQRLGSS